MTAILLLMCARSLGQVMRSVSAPRAVLATALTVMVGLGMQLPTHVDMHRYLTGPSYINTLPATARELLGRDVTIALTEAGRMAFWNDARTFDIVGLNTPEVATAGLTPDYLADLAPDLIFAHTAAAFSPWTGRSGDHFEVTPGELLAQRAGDRAWNQVVNPVERAPLVVLEHLSAGGYRTLMVRYSERYCHLYAVRQDGKIDFDRFRAALDASFGPQSALSYVDLRKR